MNSIRVRTPAKINLFLRVLARRPNGYHDIETLFQAIGLEDELLIEQSSGETRLVVPGFPGLENEKNLVLKALRWLQEETGEKLPVRIELRKKIPVAAGLGGGSSDAAAALVGISHLFKLELSDELLYRGARVLGADVPFFLMGGTAVGEGVGDRLTTVELPFRYGVILVNPAFPVSTAEVYKEYSRSLTGAAREGKLWPMIRGLRNVGDLLCNDLQAPAQHLHPELRDLEDALKRAGLKRPLMSGSGPTFFGLSDFAELEEVRKRLPDGLKVFVTLPVTHGSIID